MLCCAFPRPVSKGCWVKSLVAVGGDGNLADTNDGSANVRLMPGVACWDTVGGMVGGTVEAAAAAPVAVLLAALLSSENKGARSRGPFGAALAKALASDVSDVSDDWPSLSGGLLRVNRLRSALRSLACGAISRSNCFTLRIMTSLGALTTSQTPSNLSVSMSVAFCRNLPPF